MCLYVRSFTITESRKLTRWLRSTDSVQMRRGQVIAFSGQGMRVQEISQHVLMHEEYLRELIRRFNSEGFDGIKPLPRTGRDKELTEEEESMVVEVATAPPQVFGRPFNQWSIRKLHQYLVEKKIISEVSYGTVRNTLKRKGISFQRTRTWKRSNDEQYESKKNASRDSTKKRQRKA